MGRKHRIVCALIAACCIGGSGVVPGAADSRPSTQPGTGPAKGVELAKPRTLKEYIERYNADHLGCTIGGQTFRNFRVHIQTSLDPAKLAAKGIEHPSPPLRPDQIWLTPVNYVQDGRRWVGFRITSSKDGGLEILGGTKLPKDFKDVTIDKHEIDNCGFMSNYDIRFEVHGTAKWQRGKVGYAGLATDRLVDGQWNEAKNIGPGSRGNFGWLPHKIGQYGGYAAVNPKTPSAGAWARLCSVSRGWGAEAKAPSAVENWFEFVEATAPSSFEVRPVAWPDRLGAIHDCGIWFRMNCWDLAQTRWRADYIEFSFSSPAITDEIWTADGRNKAAPPRKLPQADPAELQGATAAKPTGERLDLDLGEGVNMPFVLIPAGKFVMGSPNDEPGRCDNEGRQRLVTISKPFYMGVFEVTQEQYKAVTGKAPKARSPKHPLEQISWSDAASFAKAMSKKTGRTLHLPTEAEWEYACRAGTTTRYPFGDNDKELGDYAWHIRNVKRTATAGQDGNPCSPGEKKPNAWGLHDMNGNVWEWCADWYADAYDSADKVDPQGPKAGQAHVLRGGSWSCLPGECRSASRWIGSHGDTQDTGTVGFRLVCEAGEAR
ncbi:MAG: formylglycine-generating enzyme family protein [Phycisphaerae bacterium]